ncbi:hypothetical protein H4R24_000786 [Coemansia sp. RSA 988]|nr:hypothetical protein H4R24_000786 [Coemansia sp. RSA 988]
MKLVVASVIAFASSAFAALSINNPVAGTIWSTDNKPVTVSWVSDDGSPLTGKVSVELMEGTDQNDLKTVLHLASDIDAAVGDLTFTPPTDLPGSKYYAVRVTSIDGMHYSHSFQAGDASITVPVSEASSVSVDLGDSSSDAESDDSQTGKDVDDEDSQDSTDEESNTDETTDESDSDSESDSSDSESSSESTDEEESDTDTDTEETETEETEDTDTEEADDTETDEETSSGASRSVFAIGILGLTAVAAMF